MKKKLLLIVNPYAGKMRAKNELLGICKIFCEADFTVTVHVTRCQSDATRAVVYSGREYDVIVACGGDGTLNEVVTGALRIGFTGAIGFLPCGTTNDFAGSLGIPKNLSAAARLVAEGKAGFLDFGSFNGDRTFTYVATFGAFTDVAYATDQKLKNVLGHAAYVTEAIARLKDLRPYRVRVVCDGKEYEDDFLFGAALNSLSIGGVLKLKRELVDLSDGMHEVLLVRNVKNAADLANLSVEILSGNYENKSVLFFRGKEIEFSCREPIPWCVDGEFAGNHETARVRNVHKRLKMIHS
ncbi:MAG: diacylglycerol kinase family lipid kinase [Clostridia bacterium]|nr:diacylglycerol kinase family lipid kinase [Clostridia bacterium]